MERAAGGFLSARQQPTEVLVAARRFDVEPERMAVHLHFHSEDGFDAGGARRLGELHRPVQVALVRQRDGRQMMALCQAEDRVNRERRIEEGVIAAQVQRDIRNSRRPGRVARPEEATVGHRPGLADAFGLDSFAWALAQSKIVAP